MSPISRSSLPCRTPAAGEFDGCATGRSAARAHGCGRSACTSMPRPRSVLLAGLAGPLCGGARRRADRQPGRLAGAGDLPASDRRAPIAPRDRRHGRSRRQAAEPVELDAAVACAGGRAGERDVAAELDDRARLRALFEALRAQLSAREQQAATLCYLQGLSRAEAARIGRQRVPHAQVDGGARAGRSGRRGEGRRARGDDRRRRLVRGAGLADARLAYGILDPDGERYRLALLHRHACPACRAYVRSLRGLAAVLPPVARAAALGTRRREHRRRGRGAAPASAAAGDGRAGCRGDPARSGAGVLAVRARRRRRRRGAAGGGWWLAGGPLGAKLAVELPAGARRGGGLRGARRLRAGRCPRAPTPPGGRDACGSGACSRAGRRHRGGGGREFQRRSARSSIAAGRPRDRCRAGQPRVRARAVRGRRGAERSRLGQGRRDGHGRRRRASARRSRARAGRCRFGDAGGRERDDERRRPAGRSARVRARLARADAAEVGLRRAEDARRPLRMSRNRCRSDWGSISAPRRPIPFG